MSGVGGSITCPRCSAVSHNIHDVEQSYCGQCHMFHDQMGRHGYCPQAVNEAIAASNRHGRRIGGKEAKMIHRLLRGR